MKISRTVLDSFGLWGMVFVAGYGGWWWWWWEVALRERERERRERKWEFRERRQSFVLIMVKLQKYPHMPCT
ncbi:hypothetical protein HanXRQr2_Chr16g0723491 [Helianthus annuus]|uniref:Transmembrane protein n=1 Tax=Helianthus annuus TaxID=4232 RepID=A0A9K3DPF4_HELAN|nr:hypothetical protein HanXRQr2_Chr16g0723491 [Helianthus annuus]KAJ0436365.1 hypothetical protein HanHA300_Chr16g0589961 [Helianthus annuus]